MIKDTQIADLNARLTQERQQNENQIALLKKKMADMDSKSLLLLTENERLMQTVRDRDNEVENWKRRVTNIDQEYKKQMELLREQLNTSTTQVIVNFTNFEFVIYNHFRILKLETRQADSNLKEPSWKTNSRTLTQRSRLSKIELKSLTKMFNVKEKITLKTL